MTFPSAVRALHHRDFRIFFAGQAVALVGSWMQQVAQSWLVLSLTDSPFRLGLIGTLSFTPSLLFAVLAGAVADRVPKRRWLVITQSVLLGQTLVLAVLVWAGEVRYWHVCVLAVVWGVANTADLPTRQSFVMDLVGRADLASAVSLNSAAFNAARVVGPAVAGLLIARAGMAPAFFINASAFVVVLSTLAQLRARGVPVRRGETTIGQEIREGVGYAVRTRRIVLILALLFVVSVTVFNFSVYVPLLARDVLHQGAEGFGFLMACLGAGAVGGALSVGALGGPRIGVVSGAAVVSCAGLIALSVVSRFDLAAAGLFVVGWASVMVVTGCNAMLQLAAPDHLRGRVMSLHTLVFVGVFPIGALLIGTVAEHRGVSHALLVAGSGGLLGLAALLGWWKNRRA